MARSLNGSSQYLDRSVDPVGSVPLTLSCWFRADNATQLHPLVSIESTAYSDWISLLADGVSAGDPIQANAAYGGSVSVATVSSFSANTWHHAAATFYPVFGTFIGDRYAFLNGVSGAKGSGTQSYMRTPIRLRLGFHGGYGAYLSGSIAEVGVWSVALTDAEIAAMADGYTPLQIRPQSLVAYYPLGGHYGQLDVDRWKNRYDLTPSGSPTWADHPRVIYQRRSFWFPTPISTEPTVYTLEALPASVDVAGQSASLAATRRITASPATIEVVGQAATLRVVRKIVASPATVDVVGQSATLTRARTLTANAAEVQVSGQAAGLTASRSITASPSTIEVVGQAADMRVVRRIVASPATVEVVGQSAVTRRTALLQGLAATIAVVGQAAVLTYSGEAAVIPEDWIGIDKAIGRTPQATATHRVGTATAVGRVSKSTAYQRPV